MLLVTYHLMSPAALYVVVSHWSNVIPWRGLRRGRQAAYAATRVHSAYRQRDGVAAYRVRRRTGQAADDRLLGRDHAYYLELIRRCFSSALARARLDRWL